MDAKNFDGARRVSNQQSFERATPQVLRLPREPRLYKIFRVAQHVKRG